MKKRSAPKVEQKPEQKPEHEQVYLSPNPPANKVYFYTFSNTRLWSKFFTHPPKVHKINFDCIKLPEKTKFRKSKKKKNK